MFAVILAMVAEFNRTSDFLGVEGEITEISREIKHYGTDVTNYKYVYYTYEVDGQEYQAKYRLLISVGKSVGDKIIMRYNPDNPKDTRDIFRLEILMYAVIFTGIFMIFTIFATFGFIDKIIKNRGHTL